MDIIGQLASQIEISRDKAEAGAGALLGLIREKAPAADFQALLAKVPEISSWMTKSNAVSATADAGPAAGGLLGSAGGLLGGLASSSAALGGSLGKLAGDASAAAAVLSVLGKLGIDAQTAAKFAPMLLELLQSKAGAAVMQRIASSVPMVREALGSAGLGGIG